ncbi:MAG: sigma-54-dependent Fis family transcriptional regulator [Oligoflexia bacterium]|nr:sigma-54-dependent Fis family transcriptional regulator [Oligoflexia bacterium]
MVDVNKRLQEIEREEQLKEQRENNNINFRVLVVDDNELFIKTFISEVSPYAIVEEAYSTHQARAKLDKNNYDMAFFDYHLGENDYIDFNLIKKAAKEKNIYTVMLTVFDDEEVFEKAFDHGVHEYLVKTRGFADIIKLIQKRSSPQSDSQIEEFIKCKFITQDKDTIRSIKAMLTDDNYFNQPVFIEGQTGVGKTLLAEASHEFLLGKHTPFIHVNCSTIPENLIESELFGHVKGAFTDAKTNKIGKLKQAENGTLFLDEIATMPKKVQEALLVAIEKKQFMPVGGSQLVKSQFRLVCATNENMSNLIENKIFRSDFFCRLYRGVVPIKPLCERVDDIPLLFEYIIRRYGNRRIHIRSQAMDIIKRYSFPGNVRDVEDIVDLLMKKQKGRIDVEDLPDFVIKNENRYMKNSYKELINDTIVKMVREKGLAQYMEVHKKMIIDRFVEMHDGKIAKVMEDMKYNSRRIYEKIDVKKSKFKRYEPINDQLTVQ